MLVNVILVETVVNNCHVIVFIFAIGPKTVCEISNFSLIKIQQLDTNFPMELTSLDV